MTFNNSVLLIIKQNEGIDYNELFARIASRYKNESSANSALCRALKNLTSFGQIKSEGHNYFITDKGVASISIEMKEKLVLKLNENMKRPMNNLEETIQLLIVLSQRSSLDNDLLINAKENASFTIKDIQDIRKKITKEKAFLKKMDSLIKDQEDKLKDLDFNDSCEINFDEKFVERVISFSNGKKIVFELNDKSLIEKIPFPNKNVSEIIVGGEQIKQMFDVLLDYRLSKATIYVPKVKIRLRRGKAKIFSSYSVLENFLKD
jgi:hypothetical protein